MAPATVSAALLIGFHDFVEGTGTEPTVTSGVFKGTVVKPSKSIGAGGSNSATYGDGSSIGSTNDGFIRLAGATSSVAGAATFTVTNTSLADYTLDTLYFDAAKLNSAPNHDIKVSYTITGASGYTTLGTVGGSTYATVPDTAPTAAYSKLSYFLDFVLGAGEAITFKFESASARIDNIAITGELVPVPEPGSVVALGGLLGGGFFLRSRRRA